MTIIFILLPISLVLGAVFLVLYLFSARSGQFEDLTTPALRMLHDEMESNLEK
jgi:cbb3-type cytochrome oxidase maturation protein